MVKTILSAARGNSGSGTVAAGATGYFWPGTSSMQTSPTETSREVTWRTPGTISKLYFRIVVNSSTAPSTLRLRKNGADSGMGQSIPAGTTGFFEDTVNTVTVSAGDKLAYQLICGAGGAISCSLISVIFDASTNCVNRLVCEGYGVNTASVTHFLPIVGDRSGTTAVEANTENIIKISGIIKNAFLNVATNARTTNTIYTLRKNGVDTAITFTYGNLETGIKEDTTNLVSVVPNDKLAWSITTGAGTQTSTFQTIALDFETTTGESWISAGSAGASADTVVLEPVTTTYAIGGGMFPSTTESQHQMKAREAFTFKNLIVYVAINTIDAACTFSLRKNGVNAMSVTIGPNATGYLANTSDTVVVAEGDLINYRIVTPDVVGTQSMTIRQMSITSVAPEVIQVSGVGGGSQGRSPLYRTRRREPEIAIAIVRVRIPLEYEVEKLSVQIALPYTFVPEKKLIKYASAILTPLARILPLPIRPTPPPVQIKIVRLSIPLSYEVTNLQLKAACSYQVDRLFTQEEQHKIVATSINFLLSDF
jgi:hypothetical protein